MKTLLIQDYLRSGKTLQDLIVEHGVYSTITNGKIALSYDQIEAKQADLLACECRGLVLEEETYNIIAFPFQRFFNKSEEHLTPKDFDWNSAKFYNKLDGSLNIVYYYKNKWYVGTRSRSEADGNIDNSGITFANLFDMTIKDMWVRNKNLIINSQTQNINIQTFMDLFKISNINAKDYTFMFELTSPYNRIVCNYPNLNLTLLGVRNNITFQEEDPELWLNEFTDTFGLKIAEKYNFNDISHMIEVVNSWKPEEQEGVVVVDKNFNRIKVKNIAYCMYNRMRDSLSTSIKGCIEAILLGKDDDLIGMMPELISNRLTILKPAIQKVFHQSEIDYEEIKNIDNMKEFASFAEFKLWPSAMYALKRNKVKNIHDFALGRVIDGKIPSSALETMLNLCEKVDPTIKELKLTLPG